MATDHGGFALKKKKCRQTHGGVRRKGEGKKRHPRKKPRGNALWVRTQSNLKKKSRREEYRQ